MILSLSDIVRYIEQGCDVLDPLIIAPMPDVAAIKDSGAASIDLRLGCWFQSFRLAKLTCIEVDPDFESRKSHGFTKLSFVPFGEEFVVHPRSFVLGITLEWIRLKTDLAGVVTGKSSWGRRGLVIATATGVHPGFTGCLTLEIANLGEIPVKIKPGMPICQLFLHRVERRQIDAPPSNIDQSPFNGKRMPVVGKVALDDFYRALSSVL